ncbi:MAG TPA: spore coat U domain-containing protein [Allosphingosinicella sp.]|jgi:spore coat protein U-like protein|nr:spore coat U domain-containing protein [Allosphingosinicella sp.]
MMVKHITGAALAASVAAAFTAPADAATTSANLGVSATNSSTCTLSTSPVAFGTMNAVSGSSVDAAGSITVTCTNGTSWSAAADAGSGSGATLATRKLVSGGNLLNYALYTDSARTNVWGDGSSGNSTLSGTGSGSAQNVTVYGRIAAGQTGAPAGSYSDTVSVTVTY